MSTVLHAGFHKTGTTTLQNHFFPALPGCAYAGPSAPTFSFFRLLARNLWGADDDEYLEHAWRGYLDDVRGDASSLVVSYENFSRRRSGSRTAQRLQRLMPDARVVLCVRNQATLLPSMYHQYLKHGGPKSMAGWADGDLERDQLRFDVVVAEYQDAFGADRVTVLRYEDLLADPATFLAGLERLIGVPDSGGAYELPVMNRSLSGSGRVLLRQANRVYRHRRYAGDDGQGDGAPSRHDAALALARRLDHRLQREAASAERRDQQVIERLLPEWAESNARLQELAGVHLEDQGYPLP